MSDPPSKIFFQGDKKWSFVFVCRCYLPPKGLQIFFGVVVFSAAKLAAGTLNGITAESCFSCSCGGEENKGAPGDEDRYFHRGTF